MLTRFDDVVSYGYVWVGEVSNEWFQNVISVAMNWLDVFYVWFYGVHRYYIVIHLCSIGG